MNSPIKIRPAAARIDLGHLHIPGRIKTYVPDVMRAWPRDRRDVWEVRPRHSRERPGVYPGHYLEDSAVEFLEQTLGSFGLEWDERGHSLVVFGDVDLHADEGTRCNGKAGSFFHLVLAGSATFELPNVRDKSLRSLRLEPGVAFVFNPNVAHRVTEASAAGVATLSAIVPRNPGIRAREAAPEPARQQYSW